MDPKSKINGKGRGSFLLEMMRQKAQNNRSQMSHSVETPSVSSTEQTSRSSEEYSSIHHTFSSSSSSGGRGRAQLVTLLKSMSSESEKDSSSSVGHGRGTLPALMKKFGKPSTSTQGSVQRDDSEGVLGKLADISVYDNPSSSDLPSPEITAPICRRGKSGTKVETFSNYIDLKIEPGKGLFQHEVKFSPEIDSLYLRRKLLNQHSNTLGRTKTFDGVILYLPIKLPQDVSHFNSIHPNDGSQIILTIIYKKKQSMSENIQFFNVLFNRIMLALRLVRIGRQNFNPRSAHVLPQH